MTLTDTDPEKPFTYKKGDSPVLLIACGALAREIVDLVELNRWNAYDLTCLPAIWHNRPQYIVDGVRKKIHAAKGKYEKIFVVYGDCGTGGQLDAMLEQEGVERIAGPHCYSFYSGTENFSRTESDDITSFYLTDYLARHFEKLIWQGLALDKHPHLLPEYFGNYKKLVYLAQTDDENLKALAKAAAKNLGLEYEYRFTGYGDLASRLQNL